MELPRWAWAFALFRAADGVTHGLFALLLVLEHELPVWTVAGLAAAMNLASIPALLIWSRLLSRSKGRRRAATAGFAVSGAVLATLALGVPAWGLVVGAILFTVAGAATAPASSVLVLEGRDRKDWARATGALSRRTGLSYLAGLTFAMVLALGKWLPFPVLADLLFVLGAGSAFLAAWLAWNTIAPYHGAAAPRPAPDAETLQAAQRRNERAVWFPMRLMAMPRFHKPRPIYVAAGLMFFGTVVFLAGYPGVLVERLALSAGMVLAVQIPASVTTQFTYRRAGEYGGTRGHGDAVVVGAALRVVAVAGLCTGIFLGGPLGFGLLIVMHAVLGVSFAFLQVNGSVFAASQTGRHAEGVGMWHAAVATGTLCGSLVATALLAWGNLAITFIVAVTATFAGLAVAFAAARDA